MLTRKWYLSALPFKRLVSNHLNRDTEARSRDSITCSTFLAERFGVLSSVKFAISISLCIRNKSAKNILNRSGHKIGPSGTPNITASHSLYELSVAII